MSINFVNQDEIKLMMSCLSAKESWISDNPLVPPLDFYSGDRLNTAAVLTSLSRLSDKLSSWLIGLSFTEMDVNFTKVEISLITESVSHNLSPSGSDSIHAYRLLDKLHYYRMQWTYDDKLKRIETT